jgi:hypothetical protein
MVSLSHFTFLEKHVKLRTIKEQKKLKFLGYQSYALK